MKPVREEKSKKQQLEPFDPFMFDKYMLYALVFLIIFLIVVNAIVG